MAREALVYDTSFFRRCTALAEGSIAALRNPTATNASLTQMLASSGNVYSGLSNAINNRYRQQTEDPIAQNIAQLWNKSNF